MPDRVNLFEIAMHSKTFDEYRQKRELLSDIDHLNRMYVQTHTPKDRFTKKAQPNLKELAKNSANFYDFNKQSHEGE
jgi:hypothetical protein